MKTLRYLILCFVVCCLFTGNVFAQCTVQLDDSIFPNSGVYYLGDTIEYEITLAIPPNNGATYCELPLFEAYFLNPTAFSGSNACTDPNNVAVLAVDPLSPGDSYFFDSGDIAQLSYVIQQADLVQVPGLEGWYIVAKLCSDWTPDSDSKTVINRVLAEPCIQVTKEACGYSKVGDDVIYTITIENCGDVDLLVLSIDDSLLGPIMVPSACGTLLVGESCKFDVGYTVQLSDPDPLINEITVEAESTFDGAIVDANDFAEVDLLHPDFTISVDCNSIDSKDGCFDVVVTNNGDVDLNITDGAGPLPDYTPLGAGKSDHLLLCVNPESDGNCGYVASLAIDAIGTIPPEYCELPNKLERSDKDSCVLPANPSFKVEKICLTDPVPADANALFEIKVTNTGDIDLDFVINDAAAGIVDLLVGPIGPGKEYIKEVEVPAECVDGSVSNEVTVVGTCPDGTEVDKQTVTAECGCGGEEGCTPGFWKNHPDCWCPAYAPETLVSDVWTELQNPPYDTQKDKKSEFSKDTLMDALNYGGGRGLDGAVRNLLRHATAALLNGCSSNVEYPVSDSLVIDLGNAALATQDIDIIQELHGVVAGFNEDNPCPIDAHCIRHDDDEASIDY